MEPIRDEMQKNVFSIASECLFLILWSICGRAKLALNQKKINNAENQTPVVVHFFCKKRMGADIAWFSIRKFMHLIDVLY